MSVLNDNEFHLNQGSKLFGDIFTPIVRLELFDFTWNKFSTNVLNLTKQEKNICFIMNGIQLDKSRVVIDKQNIVSATTMRQNGWHPHITMDNI